MSRKRPDRFSHPRVRAPIEWRGEIDRARPDALVVLDALETGDIHEQPALYDKLPWLLRVAVQNRKVLSAPSLPASVGKYAFVQLWIFRPAFDPAKTRTGRGDVFCLFCCTPLKRNVLERSLAPVSPIGRQGPVGLWRPLIDHGTDRQVRAHGVRCALQFVAGLRELAPWGSVTYPDPELAA